MTAPLIGITTSRYDSGDGRHDVAGKAMSYSQSIQRAGGLPVMVPLGLAEETLRALFARLDGVLFTGGGDMDPARFGLEASPEMYDIDPDRDRMEVALAQWAAREDKPFLGICRGIQVMNVALGGSLHLDIASELAGCLKHDYYPGHPYDLLVHPISISEESLLARIVGTPIVDVNSMHHQAAKDAAPGLRVTARAPDGIIEALEVPNHPFGLGVQWHPERLPDSPQMQTLFRAFVDSAKQ